MSDSEDEVEYEPEEFQLGEFKISVTTVAYLPITKLLANQSKSVEISGQKLWCGSLCLVNHLLSHPALVENAVTVELGAGTGVASMICAKLRASCCIATDHDERSIEHMKTDFATNNTVVSVERLDWYRPEMETIAEAIGDTQGRPIHLVAGDVLYKTCLLVPFFNTVSAFLARYPSAKLLLCHVPRAGVKQEDVVRAAQAAQLEVAEHQGWTMQAQLATYCPEEDLQRARLYSMSLGSSTT